MGISEFAVHNVLRTYNRQERLGRVHRPRGGSGSASRSSDQVTLSPAARKAQWIGNFAAEIVDDRYPGLPVEEAATRAKTLADELLSRHGGEVGDDGLTPETFENNMRGLYAGRPTDAQSATR